MPVPNIIVGQNVTEIKRQRAKEMRREMTLEEKILWLRLRANRLCGLHFRRQQVIDGFIVDFYCHAAAVVVEVDGPIHEQQAGYDQERDTLLVGRGFRVLRFKNEEIRAQLAVVLDRISAACRDGVSPGA